jgi:hypothetical protein
MPIFLIAAGTLLGAAAGGTLGYAAAGLTGAAIGVGVGTIAGVGIGAAAYAASPRVFYPVPYPYGCGPYFVPAFMPRGPVYYTTAF